MKLGELRELARALPGLEGADAQEMLQERMLDLDLDPSTVYQELEMTSRYVDTHRDVTYANAQLQLHSHTFYELLYCANSCGAEYLVGPERYRLQQGDIIFVPPGISHRPLLPKNLDTPYTRYILWLSPEFMDLFSQMLPYPFTEKQARANLLRTRGTPWEFLGDLFAGGIAEAEARADGWEAAVIGNTLTLLTQIKRATDDRAARALKAEKPELLDRLIAYVEQNYTRNLTIRDLSQAFYISSSTISHLFTQKLGVSFYRYVTQRRLIRAKALIARGLPLETVAAQSGFGDYSAFYRAFRKDYGISPRQYRALREPAQHPQH